MTPRQVTLRGAVIAENDDNSIDLTDVKTIVDEYFPENWPYIEACLSAIATLYIEDIKDPASLILIGQSSGGKGTSLNPLKDNKVTYWTDSFTPASFVSHASNRSKEQLEENDLLPRIKDKAVIIPELAPFFSARKDALIKNISILTRLFDGEGLVSDSGTHGRRGYTGEHRFTLIGGTTPLHKGVWKTLGKLGNRLCFVYLDDFDETRVDLVDMLIGETDLKEKTRALNVVIKEFLTQLDDNGKVDWTRKEDPKDIAKKILTYAKLSGKLRGYIETEKINGSYVKGFPQVEAPMRFSALLYNLARGRALIHGRSNIDESDIELVRRVALSSCYTGRFRLMNLLIENNGLLETEDVELALNCSKTKALDVMSDLVSLEILVPYEKTLKNGGKTKCVKLKREYRDLLL